MNKKSTIRTDELTGKRYLCIAEGSSPQAALNDIISNHRKKLTECNKEMFRQRYDCTVNITELYGNSNYCPADNAGYRLIEINEVEDLDGSKCGTVLAKTETGSYATWQYTFFPKDDFLNGFNNGNYFNNELAAVADYHKRSAERAERIAEQWAKRNSSTLNDSEHSIDNEDMEMEI